MMEWFDKAIAAAFVICIAVISFPQELSDECSELLEWLDVVHDDDQDPRLHELGLGGVGRRYGTGRLRALHTDKP